VLKRLSSRLRGIIIIYLPNYNIAIHHFARDIKTRLIDSQADSSNTVVGSTEGSVKINQNNDAVAGGCC
jgi:hypothetical protein